MNARGRQLAEVAAALIIAIGFRLFIRADLVDDAYITLSSVQNLVNGQGLTFNPGQRDHVLTTVLWPLLLAIPNALGFEIVAVTKILGALAELFLVAAAVYLGSTLVGVAGAGLLTAVLVIANPVVLLNGFGGMETPLFLGLIAVSAASLERGRERTALILASAVVWARFDGLAFYLVVVAAWLWRRRRELDPRTLAQVLTPSLAVLLAYFVFGVMVLGSAVPWSAKYKLGFATSGGLTGGIAVAREFLNAFIGKSAFWFIEPTAYVFLVPLLLVGVFRLLRDRELAHRFGPLLAFSVGYSAAFVLSGTAYATNFPWYFVPPLLAAYALTVAGFSAAYFEVQRLVRPVASRPSDHKPELPGPTRARALPVALTLTLAFVWAAVLYPVIRDDAERLESRLLRYRERLYAAAAVWAGRIVPEGPFAANEIGAVGFFAPPGVEVLDLFGLARRPGEHGLHFVDLVARRRPVVIITKENFSYKAELQARLPNMYEWEQKGALFLGLRYDRAQLLRAELPRFDISLEEIDLARAYDWSVD